MKVSEAVDTRLSVRAFLPDPVPTETLTRVLEHAARAPSGGNVQPWIVTVLNGETLTRFREEVIEPRLAKDETDEPEYDVYPPSLWDPYRTRRFGVGEDMYELLRIERGDKPARLEWLKNNYRFFGAPAAIFCHVDRGMGPPQWSDLGMYLQTVMLLLREEGLDSCAQEAWARHHKAVDTFVEPPENTMLFCGMAIGKRDPEAPVNMLRSKRAPTQEWLRVL
ncbi:MAG: nitroreductase [Paracoccaceae bacterium]